jgi:hypothetical protein
VRAPITTLTAGLLAAALLTGCSGGDGDEATSADTAAEGAGSTDTGGSGGGGDQSAPADTTLEQLRVAPGPAVIRTAELSVRVDDVRAAADEAAEVATTAGGGRESEQRSGTAEQGSAVLVLRVPPDAFDATVRTLAELGEERDRQLGTQDVTEEVVDLEARLATQRASVERVRALLDEAEALGEIVQIEGELTKRTADLEALQARLESLTARVHLSTITLRLDSEGGPVAAGGALGFGDGLASGWSALVTTARLVAVTVGALLPFVPLLLVGALVWWRLRARRVGVVQA